ncbi:MAG: hypothetical protein ACJAQ4_002722 [Cryomorphaceae bacterium]|jgi:hypothetical protein
MKLIKFPVYLSQSIARDPLGNASMIIASRVAEELNKMLTLLTTEKNSEAVLVSSYNKASGCRGIKYL